MQIRQRQKDELGKQLPQIVKHWKQIAEHIGRSPHRLPKSLEYFSREEAGRILDLLATMRVEHRDFLPTTFWIAEGIRASYNVRTLP
jgi:hypothetical protein